MAQVGSLGLQFLLVVPKEQCEDDTGPTSLPGRGFPSGVQLCALLTLLVLGAGVLEPARNGISSMGLAGNE